MKWLNSLALLLCLLIVKHYGLANATKSKSILIERLQWGSMGTYMTTSGNVWYLEEDAWLPGNILFSSGDILATTDGKTTHLVAGSVHGYGEGELAQAKFSSIRGFLQTSSNQILVADITNNCLRYINRITNLTSQFVGNCTSQGFSDGLYRNARFFHPWSVISNPMNPNEAIVTDYSNGAIRSIDLAKGDVQTLIKGISSPTDATFDSDKENIFISSIYTIGKLNLKTLIFTLLPMQQTGAMDGDFNKASFTYARGILCKNKVCLVADGGSHRLRIVDVEKQMVYSICTGLYTVLTNGPITNCSLRRPLSLLLKSDTLYIGEWNAIRNISLRGFFPCEDIILHLSGQEQRKCIEVVPGHNICLTPGIFMYNIPEKNCSIKINITKDLDACESNPCLNSGICKAGGNKTYTCTCSDGWTGRNCQMGIDACTVNPCKNSGTCSVVNGAFVCSCMPGLSGVICERELKNLTCSEKITVVGDLLTMKANVSLWLGDQMSLGVGKYIYYKLMTDGSLCTTNVDVNDPRMNWRLDINADYKISCNVLKNFKDLLLTIAKLRHNQIPMISSGYCNKSADHSIELSCENDVLNVSWPTDCMIPYKDSESHKFVKVIEDFLKKIIYPLLNKEGRQASVVLTPVCSGGLKYHNTTDMCQ